MRGGQRRSDAMGNGFQHGAYTIFFVAVLGLLTLLAVRSMTTSTVNSVRLTSNSHNATEAFLAAEEAMALGMEWLANGDHSYSEYHINNKFGIESTLNFDFENMGGRTTTRAYQMYFWFEGSPGESMVKVFGYAESSTQSGATTVSQWVSLNSLLQPSALDAPLAVAGCLNVASGVPDIYADTTPVSGSNTPSYDSVNDNYVTFYRGPTRKTNLWGQPAGENCDEGTGLEPEPGDSEAPDPIWRLNNHSAGNKQFANSAEPIGLSEYSGGDLWPEIFTESRDWFDDLIGTQEGIDSLAAMNIYYWNGAAPAPGSAPDTDTWPSTIRKSPNGSSGDNANNTGTFDYDGAPQPGQTFSAWGTFANPAIVIYRGTDCPDLGFNNTGNYIIVGVLYIESASNPENAALACTADKWQRFMMLGTLVINGDLKIFQKNPEIISAEVGGIYDTKLFPVTGVYGTAGTWKVQEN
jgi:Tfp pilus assembly protein PilX